MKSVGQVLEELLVQLGWNYIAIAYDSYGSSVAKELWRLVKKKRICVPIYAELPDTSFDKVALEIVGNVCLQCLHFIIIKKRKCEREIKESNNANKIQNCVIIRNKFIDTQVKKKYILNYSSLYIFITNLKMNEAQRKKQ